MTEARATNPWVAGYLEVWRRYGDFGGVTAPGAYLRFFLLNLAITLLLHFVGAAEGSGFVNLLGVFYGLAALLPGLAVTVRLIRYLVSGAGDPSADELRPADD